MAPESSEAEIAALHDRVMNDCSAYSIRRECDVARYAAILLRNTPPARTFSKAGQNILLAYGKPAEERLSQLEQFLAASER
jgi:hypothetical protein